MGYGASPAPYPITKAAAILIRKEIFTAIKQMFAN